LAPGVDDLGQWCDVASRAGDSGIAAARRFLLGFVVLSRPGILRSMALVEEPAEVAQEVDVLAVADAEAGAQAMAIDLALVDDRAQSRAVEQAHQVGGFEAARIKSHGR